MQDIYNDGFDLVDNLVPAADHPSPPDDHEAGDQYNHCQEDPPFQMGGVTAATAVEQGTVGGQGMDDIELKQKGQAEHDSKTDHIEGSLCYDGAYELVGRYLFIAGED